MKECGNSYILAFRYEIKKLITVFGRGSSHKTEKLKFLIVVADVGTTTFFDFLTLNSRFLGQCEGEIKD